ncbi:MAG TPA: glutamine--fructose-6-phosphate transaminase (isomerizing) [Pseudonocardiaceae bacterium]|jgi:glucosamine--fructose-6-phosphate aminotransferase (isomerizing)|nr:glutamine--fructose-6-phosphate transaminase (isomerizing) [Pseudonocardiaceae bacterium]
MCGIVGYVGSTQDAVAVLLEGLRRLEYRGYDSAGVAVQRAGELVVCKAAGRVEEISGAGASLRGASTGIAHTRWATHGPATTANAHPHTAADGRIALVHNGIIENAELLRTQLTRRGARFASQTDSEVLAHLIAEAAGRRGTGLADAVREALRGVEGTYGLLVVHADEPGLIVAARSGSPLVIGLGDGEMFIASDVSAIVHHTQQVVYLEDGEVATVRADGYQAGPIDSRRAGAAGVEAEPTALDYDLAGFADFMDKEINEQPEAVSRALRGRLDERLGTARLDGLRLDPRTLCGIRRVKFLGCGSAYYAGQLGAGLVESLARIPADAEPAAEFRYRHAVVDPDCLYIAVSQSGETFDTLAAVRELRRKGALVIGAVNVVGSALARECGSGIFLHAGPEISVASTKAFTNMAVSFALLGLLIGRTHDMSTSQGQRLIKALQELPQQIRRILDAREQIAAIADRYADAEHMFFIGRVRAWPVAREGAQKLKEISYVHAEAYQASELKHGPLALINPAMPSIVLVPDDELVAKNLATIEQIKARGGPVVAVTNTDLDIEQADDVIRVPAGCVELDPILLTIPLQVFAYHLARKLGRDIDKPRNLAKSVTVE